MNRGISSYAGKVPEIAFHSVLLSRLTLLSFLGFVIGVFEILRRVFMIEDVTSIPIQLTTLLGLTFCFAHAVVRLGVSVATRMLILTLGTTMAIELTGVLTGRLFGSYQYTERLGNLFFDIVPYIIPPAWFMMLYPSYLIAIRVLARHAGWIRTSAVTVAGLGSLIMTTWDLVIDPVMVVGGYWTWEKQDYYGVPFTNYFGWWGVSFAILFLFAGDCRHTLCSSGKDYFDRLALLFYGIVGLGSAMAAIGVGLLVPALLGSFAMAFWLWLGWRRPAVAAPPVHEAT